MFPPQRHEPWSGFSGLGSAAMALIGAESDVARSISAFCPFDPCYSDSATKDRGNESTGVRASRTGWEEVADYALEWAIEHTEANGSLTPETQRESERAAH